MSFPDGWLVDVPEPLLSLLRSLILGAFSVVSERYDEESFGNWQAVLEHGALRIEMRLDRGSWDIGWGGKNMETTGSMRLSGLSAWRESRFPIAGALKPTHAPSREVAGDEGGIGRGQSCRHKGVPSPSSGSAKRGHSRYWTLADKG